MTQETRIGLLVGLMFIIAFGLILAELTGDAFDSPSSNNGEQDNYLWDPVAQVAPARVNPEPIELPSERLSRPPQQTVETLAAAEQAPSDEGDETLATAELELPAGIGEPLAPHAAVKPPQSLEPIAAAIKDSRGPPKRYYTVRTNDTLIKIARKVYGRGGGRYYKRIYRANTNILEDESVVYAGQNLLIPPLRGRSGKSNGVRSASPARYEQMDLTQLREHFSAHSADSAIKSPQALRQVVYIVREGDTLTSIASRTLNDGGRSGVAKMFQANRDKLQSPDELLVGMTLRIPK